MSQIRRLQIFLSVIQLGIFFIVNLQGQKFLKRREMNLELLIKLQQFSLQLLLDDKLSITFLNRQIGFQDIQDGKIDHAAPIMKTAALKKGVFAWGQLVSLEYPKAKPYLWFQKSGIRITSYG